MTQDQPNMQGRKTNEKDILEEMIQDPQSQHWQVYLELVERWAGTRMKGIPRDDQEDILQEIKCKIVRHLSAFRQDSTFSTWVFPIIHNCVTDWFRRNKRRASIQEESLSVHFERILEYDEIGHEYKAIEERSVEESFEVQEAIREGIGLLFAYAHSHSNSVRNIRILELVILKGYSYVDAAKEVCCEAAVIGYVVREAQRYAREHKQN